eukprot:6357597-Prymnesium_polylepis.1
MSSSRVRRRRRAESAVVSRQPLFTVTHSRLGEERRPTLIRLVVELDEHPSAFIQGSEKFCDDSSF